MNNKDLALQLLEIGLDESGKRKPLTVAMAKQVKELLLQSDISISSIDELKQLPQTLNVEHLAISKGEKHALYALLKQWNISSGEKLSETPADVITHLNERNKLLVSNKNGLNDSDLAALTSRSGLRMREVAAVKYIYVPELGGEITSSTKVKMRFSAFNSGTGRKKVRSMDNLKNSSKWKTFISQIPGAEILNNDEFFDLCNIIANRMGISQNYDEVYLGARCDAVGYLNLPLTHDTGRVLRGVSVLLGDGYVHPLSLTTDGMVAFVVDNRVAHRCGYSDGYTKVHPLLKIRSS